MMDNPGFQHDVEAAGDSNLSTSPNASNPYVMFRDNNPAWPGLTSSSSFNIPKKSNVCKYRRFSGSLSMKRSRVNILKDLIESPKRNFSVPVENILKNEPIYCSISEMKPKNVEPDQERYVDIGSSYQNYAKRPKLYDTPVSNNLKSSFHDQKSSNLPSVPSPPLVKSSNYALNRSLSSSEETQRYTPSPCFMKRINTMNCGRTSPPVLKKRPFQSEDESIMTYLAKGNSVAAKNSRNLHQDYLRPPETVNTISAGVPMFLQQASPRPSADNRRNLRTSSKMLRPADGEGSRLKRRGVRRGWKLQFIPSERAHRRHLALCCVLGLACTLVLLATALVVYVTTVLGPLAVKSDNSKHVIESGVNVVAGEFQIVNEKYAPSFQNSSSADFQQLALQITQLLDLVFSKSTLSSNYNHSHVIRLQPAAPSGIVVQCQVVLASAPPRGEAANQVGLEFLRGLEHRHGHMWLGNFIVDIQSISFVALLDDARPATGSPALVPGWSSWSPWSDCNATAAGRAPGGYTQSRTRLCRLEQGAGSALSSIEPCLLLESAGGDLEVRDCQHSNETDVVMSASMFEDDEKPRFSMNSLKDLSNNSSASSNMLQADTATAASSSVVWLENDTDRAHSSATTYRIPVMDLSLSLRHCDECMAGELCVALSKEQVPICRQPRDLADPTGCGGLCLINTELCQKLDVDAFRCVDDSYCLPSEWRCANQLCIPQVKRCDGHMNCYDRTDEHDCDCDLNSHFHCGNNTSCLPSKKRCDGVIDCWDGTDELNCTIACPSPSQFTCTDGQCIPRARFCDGYADCNDSSDEPFGCGGECKNHEWKCKNGRCIKKQMVCDGADACGDQSDEINCPPSRREQNFRDGITMEKLYIR